MSAAIGRRAALVAAMLGLLAFLGSAAAPAAGGSATVPGSSHGTVLGAVVRATAPLSTVDDTARAPQPAAVRTTGHDRPLTSHAGGWALAAAVLLLASASLVAGVRRACRRTTSTAWRRGLAPRAPPALAL